MSSKQPTTVLEGIVSQRLSESAVKGSIRWFTEDERSNWRGGKDSGLGRFSVPMGVRPDGRYIYPIAGASPDDPSNDEGGAGGSGDGGGEGGSEGQGGGDGDGTDKGADGKDSETVSKAEYDKIQERMKAADRNAAEALKKLRELEEKDLSEQEKVLKRVPELEQTVATLTEENKGLKAKVAFLGFDGFSWHDPDVALGQVDLSEVLKEDGTIDKKALKKAAEDLSKSKPFLVKSANDSGNGDGKGGDGKGSGSGGQGSSGAGVGSGGKGGSGNGVDEAALKAKYPALNV
jgi:hypothetical protein